MSGQERYLGWQGAVDDVLSGTFDRAQRLSEATAERVDQDNAKADRQI